MSHFGKTIPWAARATLLGAVVLAATACPSCATQVLAERPPQPENVLVSLVQVEGKFVVKVDKDPVYLREGKDWAQWISLDGYEVGVVFKKESPFSEPPILTPNKILKSGTPKKGTALHGYAYTVTVKVGDGNKYSLDPRIEVMP
jgi:hypothetical protein